VGVRSLTHRHNTTHCDRSPRDIARLFLKGEFHGIGEARSSSTGERVALQGNAAKLDQQPRELYVVVAGLSKAPPRFATGSTGDADG
jgi:hypothetical protein